MVEQPELPEHPRRVRAPVPGSAKDLPHIVEPPFEAIDAAQGPLEVMACGRGRASDTRSKTSSAGRYRPELIRRVAWRNAARAKDGALLGHSPPGFQGLFTTTLDQLALAQQHEYFSVIGPPLREVSQPLSRQAEAVCSHGLAGQAQFESPGPLPQPSRTARRRDDHDDEPQTQHRPPVVDAPHRRHTAEAPAISSRLAAALFPGESPPRRDS